jgi:hypothetical protein
LKKLMAVVGSMVVAAAMVLSPVLAHEDRETSDYEVIFGWRNEPAFAGQLNGPDLFIGLHDAEEVENPQAVLEALDIAMQAEIMFGPEATILTLEPAFPYYQDGYLNLVADVIPTMPGDYIFRIFGTIGDQEIEETFDSANGEFSSVEPAADILFPAAGAVDVMGLMTRIAELEARLDALESAGS